MNLVHTVPGTRLARTAVSTPGIRGKVHRRFRPGPLLQHFEIDEVAILGGTVDQSDTHRVRAGQLVAEEQLRGLTERPLPAHLQADPGSAEVRIVYRAGRFPEGASLIHDLERA